METLSNEIHKDDNREIPQPESPTVYALITESERLAERDANTVAVLRETDPEATELAICEPMSIIENIVGEHTILPERFTPDELKKLSDSIQKYNDNPGKRMSVILDYVHNIMSTSEYQSSLDSNEQARMKYAMDKYGNLSDQDMEKSDLSFYQGVEGRLVDVIRKTASKRMDDYNGQFLSDDFFQGYTVPKFFAEVSILRDVVPNANIKPSIAENAAIEVLKKTDDLVIKIGKDEMEKYKVNSARRFLRSILNSNNAYKRGGLTIKQAEAASRCILEIVSSIPDFYK
jgi:hypothetical protein